MNLKGQVVLVTGAGSGMGASTAAALHAAGAQLALIDLNHEQAQEVAKPLDGLAIACDVSDATGAEQAIAKVVSHYGKLNGCVNCAGIATAARIVGRDGPHDLAAFAKVIQVNLIGIFNMMRLCADVMSKQDTVNDDGERGVIINTASVAAFEGQIGQAAYSASKGGVVAMTLPAARELARFGIRVMTIAPGIINTPMMQALPEKVQASLAESVTFPKRLGDAAEYAELVKTIFTNVYLNGSVIRLDGGIRMAS